MSKPAVSGIDNLWSYLTSDDRATEFLKSCNLAKVVPKSGDDKSSNKYFLLDAEGALDRLYGGFYNDWINGGQWCRTYQFLTKLSKVARRSKIELVVLFNGTFEPDRICEWFAAQMELANRSDKIVQIVCRRGNPPPKAFWIPPIALDSSLKLMLSALRIPIIVSTDDHAHDVAYNLQSEPPKLPPPPPQGPTALGLDPTVLTGAAFLPVSYDGLFAESALYFALLNKVPRLLSAHSLKLSIRQTMEAKELSSDLILKHFDLPASHMHIFLSLLGSHLLTDEDLAPYFTQKFAAKKSKEGQYDWPVLLQEIATTVRDISESIVDNPSEVATKLFSIMPTEVATQLMNKFIDQSNYYKSLSSKSTPAPSSNRTLPKVVDASELPLNASMKRFAALGVSAAQLPNVISSLTESFQPVIGKIDEKVATVAKDRHARGHMHPWVLQLMTGGEIKLPVCIEPHSFVQGVNPGTVIPVEEGPPYLVHLYRPVRQAAYSVLFDIVPPTLPQPLTTAETEKDADAAKKDGKQDVVAAVKDEQKNDKKETDQGAETAPNRCVLIREWFIERANGQPTPAVDLVPSTPLQGWSNPSVSKLWLSRDSGDWLMRLKTFLACFKADSPMMSSSMYIQPHHIIPCAVLRFLLSSQSAGVLLPHEFDAFLAQTVSPALQNPDYLADMELCSLSARGMHLAAMFMRGVDHAIFVNDVCGQPIQAEYCAPWLFFDGKLFQAKLAMASQGATPRDLCEGNHDQLYLFSSLRQAILDHLQPHFSRFRLSTNTSGLVQMAPPLAVPSSSEMIVMAGNRSHQNQHLAGRDQHLSNKGGELAVGGVVVGQWAGYRPRSAPQGGSYPGFGPQAYTSYGHPSAMPPHHHGYHPQVGGWMAGSGGRRSGGRYGARRGVSAAVTGIGRGRGAVVPPGGKAGKKKTQGAGRGGSVIEKSDDPADAAVANDDTTKPTSNGAGDASTENTGAAGEKVSA